MVTFDYTFTGTSDKNFWIGARHHTNSSYYNFFNAQIDEFQIWQNQLSQEQIHQYMLNPPSGTEDGLVIYYPFDEGSGTSTEDFAGNDNPGELINTPAWISGHPDTIVSGNTEIEGFITGIWSEPVADGGSPVFAGVDTPYFQYGRTTGDTPEPNSLRFEGNHFSVQTETPFKLGTVTYYNGTVSTDSGASAVNIKLLLDFKNPFIKCINSSVSLKLESTPNEGTDWENADFVYFPDSIPVQTFAIDNTSYKLEMVGFSQDGGKNKLKEFHVLEDHKTSAELYGWITAIPNANLTHIEISGPENVFIGNCGLYTCTAYYDDGTIRKVTEVAAWSDSCESSEIDSNGLFTNKSEAVPGTCSITSDYQGKSHSFDINLVTLNTCDINGDSKIGLEEAINALQIVSGIKPQ